MVCATNLHAQATLIFWHCQLIDPRITERRNPRTTEIDLASARDIVNLLNNEDRLVADAVRSQAESVTRAVELAEAAFRSGGRLIYAGAGTSGRLGVLDASECPPTFGSDPGMVIGIIAGGIPALTVAQEGAEDDTVAGARAIDDAEVSASDFVVGIAASGTTPFVWAALVRARALGARTAMIACTPLQSHRRGTVDVEIIPVVGPEAVTGSTRMKAGTATKLVLNTISTGAMIRIGKTYGNMMIDLKMTNDKLRARAERMVMEICKVDQSRAQSVLLEANGSVKTAIVMALLDISRQKAEHRLAKVGGVIRRIVPISLPEAL